MPSQEQLRERPPVVIPRQPEAPPRPRRSDPELPWLVLAAVVTVAAWLPFLHHPLASDENGFLLLAQHWTHGTSLYGDYWVDRPPLLLWLFSLAAHVSPGTATAVGVVAPSVKLLGALASGATVLLVGVLGRLVAPRAAWPRRGAVVVAAALLCSPLLGMPEADGEVLAVPFVLLGLVLLLASARAPWGRRAMLLVGGAGAAATSAALVKQNVVDVFVFALVALVVGHRSVDRVAARVVTFATGAVGALTLALAGAATQGTSPVGVWDAVVAFRFQATAVIGSSASSATPQRMHELVAASVASGAAAVLIVAGVLTVRGALRGRRASRREPDSTPATPSLAWPALALVAWELVGVAAGGSYWLHYLTGLVPGLALLVAIARPGRRAGLLLTATVSYVVLAAAVAWVPVVTTPVVASSDARVASYLRIHGLRTDGVVVAFGHPGIVAGSGMSSPYEHLWSLPVRVRDPRLTDLEQVMTGPAAPRWIVVAGDSIGSWGLDATSVDRYLTEHYLREATFGDWHVWQRMEGPQ